MSLRSILASVYNLPQACFTKVVLSVSRRLVVKFSRLPTFSGVWYGTLAAQRVLCCWQTKTQSSHRITVLSGRKAASRNSWGPCGGPPCCCPESMDANLGSLDRVYEALAAPGGVKVIEPSDGDGAGVRVFQGVTTRTDPSQGYVCM